MKTEEQNHFSFPEVRVVEASAGSGKTYALAKRYVQLLINPHLKQDDIPLRNILAITFTNKATIEMKERILEFLKKIALDAFSSGIEKEDILSSLGVPHEAARQKAFFIMDYVIRNYNFFQVQTIDSFVNAIISGCSFRLNLSARFKIKADHSEYLAYSLDSLIDRAPRDAAVAGIFRDFLMQYLHVENRFGWFPRKSILALIDNLYAGSNIYGGEFEKTVTDSAGELLALRRDSLEKMRLLHAKMPEGTNKIFQKNLGSFLEGRRHTFDFSELSKYFTYEAFPVNKGREVPAGVSALWDALRYGLRELCRREAYYFYNCYIDIFNLVSGDFRALADKDDVLFLSELNRQANGLFANEALGVPELYYRLATRFRHFLVDEFQDTSELQWKNLLPMVEELLASGGSLFYVGDKKQAIYRFRGGDATLFDRIPVYFRNFKPRLELLDRNYRSHREIVEFNNGVFSQSSLRGFITDIQEDEEEECRLSEPEIAEVLQVFADAKQRHLEENDRGRVHIEHLEVGGAAQRNADMKVRLARLLGELRERFSWRDIAILARDNSDIELITGWLLEDKIPVESEKTLNVRENALIKELMSFLMFLHSPIDSLSFASFISGEVFSRASGLSRETARDFIFQANRERNGRPSSYLYREFREKHPGAWDGFMEEFFVNVGFVPLYELAVSILRRYRVMEHFPEHHVFVLRFLEIIKKQEEESTGIAAFIEYFARAHDNDLFVTVTNTDSVRLLTIHKAKGLEFPVVIIPFLEMKVKVSGAKDGSASFDIFRKGEGLSLVRLGRKYMRYSEELRALYLARYKRSLIDELNAIYVALTRPRCELHAYVPQKASAGDNPVRRLIPENVERGRPESYPLKVPRKDAELLPIPVSSYSDWLSLLKDEFRDEATLMSRENLRWGEALHYALSFIGNLRDGKMHEEVRKAASRAGKAFPSLKNPGEIERRLSRLLNTPDLTRFFAVENGDVGCEREVIDGAGVVRRIDRLIVRDGAVEIIDYKSARAENGGYHGQVREYMRIAGEIYPGRAVRGYIIYIDDMSVEEVLPCA